MGVTDHLHGTKRNGTPGDQTGGATEPQQKGYDMTNWNSPRRANV